MVDNIDYPLLRQQKLTLLKVIDRSSAFRYKQEEEDLTGILHLIDSIQEDAVDEEGIPETEVFGESKDN